jgi:hypothetical protein
MLRCLRILFYATCVFTQFILSTQQFKYAWPCNFSFVIVCVPENLNLRLSCIDTFRDTHVIFTNWLMRCCRGGIQYLLRIRLLYVLDCLYNFFYVVFYWPSFLSLASYYSRPPLTLVHTIWHGRCTLTITIGTSILQSYALCVHTQYFLGL